MKKVNKTKLKEQQSVQNKIISKNMSAPFSLKCSNCGSHDVNVFAKSNGDVELKCVCCKNVLTCKKYNEEVYAIKNTLTDIINSASLVSKN